MKVTRKMQFKTNDVCVGDQITVKLSGFGKFTATAQKIMDGKVLFLFDEAIAQRSMNEKRTNEGGFENSDMKKWLDKAVLPAFPKELKEKVIDITLPTYGQIFGHDDFYQNFEPDEDEQFELMKNEINHACSFNGKTCWWWLRNAMKKEVFSARFALVGDLGDAYCDDASASYGVRPVFNMDVRPALKRGLC